MGQRTYSEHRRGRARRSRRGTVALVALVALLVPAWLAGATTSAGALAADSVSNPSLSWAVSSRVGSQGVLNQSRAAVTPATFGTPTWSFTEATGAYDPDTGETTMDFTGALEFGNTTLGRQFAQPFLDTMTGGFAGVRPHFQEAASSADPLKPPAPLTLFVDYDPTDGSVDDASLGWKMSEQVWTASSLAPSRAAVAPATVGASAWNFVAGTGTYDDETGALTVDFTGGLEFGNVAQGNYGVRLSDVSIVIDAAGAGKLVADVTKRGPGSAVWGSPTADVTIVNFSTTGATITDNGVGDLFVQVTPTFEAPATPNAAHNVGVRVANPSVVVDDAGNGTLVGDVSTRPQGGSWGAPTVDVTVFTFTLAEADVVDSGTHVAWTATPPAAFAQSFLDTLPAAFVAEFTGAGRGPLPLTLGFDYVAGTPEPPPPPPEPSEDVTGGRVDWGVKLSFRDYITGGIANGSITVADGAADAGGIIQFPVDEESSTYDDGAADAATTGSVQFTGHGGLLDLQITDVNVVIDGTTGTLFADVVTLPLAAAPTEVPDGEVVAAAPEEYEDVALATLDLTAVDPAVSGLALTWASIPATLTEAGVPAFADFYPAGTALDPVTLRLEFAAAPTDPGDLPPAGGGSATATTDKSSARPGEQVTVTGAGFTPGEQVVVNLRSDPVWLGTVTANGAGTATLVFTVPDVAPGDHTIVMEGVTSGHEATGPLTVLGSPAGNLAFTGSAQTRVLAVVALAMIVLGAGLLVATRRRRTHAQA